MTKRVVIDPNKISPFNTVSVGDTVVFDVGSKYCRVGVIVDFENIERGMAVIKEICTGAIVKRNILFDFSKGIMFKTILKEEFKEDK